MVRSVFAPGLLALLCIATLQMGLAMRRGFAGLDDDLRTAPSSIAEGSARSGAFFECGRLCANNAWGAKRTGVCEYSYFRTAWAGTQTTLVGGAYDVWDWTGLGDKNERNKYQKDLEDAKGRVGQWWNDQEQSKGWMELFCEDLCQGPGTAAGAPALGWCEAKEADAELVQEIELLMKQMIKDGFRSGEVTEAIDKIAQDKVVDSDGDVPHGEIDATEVEGIGNGGHVVVISEGDRTGEAVVIQKIHPGVEWDGKVVVKDGKGEETVLSVDRLKVDIKKTEELRKETQKAIVEAINECSIFPPLQTQREGCCLFGVEDNRHPLLGCKARVSQNGDGAYVTCMKLCIEAEQVVDKVVDNKVVDDNSQTNTIAEVSEEEEEEDETSTTTTITTTVPPLWIKVVDSVTQRSLASIPVQVVDGVTFERLTDEQGMAHFRTGAEQINVRVGAEGYITFATLKSRSELCENDLKQEKHCGIQVALSPLIVGKIDPKDCTFEMDDGGYEMRAVLEWGDASLGFPNDLDLWGRSWKAAQFAKNMYDDDQYFIEKKYCDAAENPRGYSRSGKKWKTDQVAYHIERKLRKHVPCAVATHTVKVHGGTQVAEQGVVTDFEKDICLMPNQQGKWVLWNAQHVEKMGRLREWELRFRREAAQDKLAKGCDSDNDRHITVGELEGCIPEMLGVDLAWFNDLAQIGAEKRLKTKRYTPEDRNKRGVSGFFDKLEAIAKGMADKMAAGGMEANELLRDLTAVWDWKDTAEMKFNCDKRQGSGPETLTFENAPPDIYQIAVHQYQKRDNNVKDIRQGEATVTIYLDNSASFKCTIPKECAASDKRVWMAANIDVRKVDRNKYAIRIIDDEEQKKLGKGDTPTARTYRNMAVRTDTAKNEFYSIDKVSNDLSDKYLSDVCMGRCEPTPESSHYMSCLKRHQDFPEPVVGDVPPDPAAFKKWLLAKGEETCPKSM